MSDTYENEYEHQEEVEEIAKGLRLFVEALQNAPDMAAKIIEIQQQVMSQSCKAISDYCPLCRRKREFVTYIQTLAMRLDNIALGIGALSCAFRIPATRLHGLNLPQAACHLVEWYIDEETKLENERSIPQPTWYSKEHMEEDGHE